jgi:hypothetical protein
MRNPERKIGRGKGGGIIPEDRRRHRVYIYKNGCDKNHDGQSPIGNLPQSPRPGIIINGIMLYHNITVSSYIKPGCKNRSLSDDFQPVIYIFGYFSKNMTEKW